MKEKQYDTSLKQTRVHGELMNIVFKAECVGVPPEQLVRMAVMESELKRDVSGQNAHKYVVLGIDRVVDAIFTVESFQTSTAAKNYAREMNEEEVNYAKGKEIICSFHPFTRYGEHIGYTPEETG